MVSATVKFTLETGRLAEESRGNEPEPEESEVDRSSEEEEDSGIEEEALGVYTGHLLTTHTAQLVHLNQFNFRRSRSSTPLH